jgi:hypothetical protein
MTPNIPPRMRTVFNPLGTLPSTARLFVRRCLVDCHQTEPYTYFHPEMAFSANRCKANDAYPSRRTAKR